MTESSPLISCAYKNQSPLPSGTYYGSEHGSEDSQPNQRSRWFQIRRKLGWLLKECEWMSSYMNTGYYVLLVNSAIICLFILYAKVALDDDYFTRWNQGFAGLSGWNMQLANVLLVGSYSMSNFLHLRLSILCACACFVFYSITSPIGIMIDLLFFNVVMALLNIRHAIQLLYERRYVNFTPEFEQVYQSVFADFMRRTDFNTLISIAFIRSEKSHVVLKEKGNIMTSLCCLVKGRVLVTNSSGRKINQYGRNEFLEAPEWIKANLKPGDNDRFHITFTSMTQCTYIKWPRETLLLLLKENHTLKLALRAVLGIQTARIWLRSIDIKDNTPPNLTDTDQHAFNFFGDESPQLESDSPILSPGQAGGVAVIRTARSNQQPHRISQIHPRSQPCADTPASSLPDSRHSDDFANSSVFVNSPAERNEERKEEV